MKKRPTVIILPCGAYGSLADREGEPVVLAFLKEGYNTFVLQYSVGDDSVYPNSLKGPQIIKRRFRNE